MLHLALQWRRQYAEFSKTTAGQVVFFGLLFFLCYSGAIWRLLNLLFILWWVAPLFVLPAINHLNRKARFSACLSFARLRTVCKKSC